MRIFSKSFNAYLNIQKKMLYLQTVAIKDPTFPNRFEPELQAEIDQIPYMEVEKDEMIRLDRGKIKILRPL